MKTLKSIVYLFALVGIIASCNKLPKDEAILKGTVNDYKGTGCLLLSKEGEDGTDTIQIMDNGSFLAKVKINGNTEAKLYLNYLGDNINVIYCYLIPGESLDINIEGGIKDVESFGKTYKRYISTPTFTGAAQKESEYLNIPDFYDYVYKNDDETPVSFKNYLEQMEKRQNFLREKLEGTCSEFSDEKNKKIDKLPDNRKFTYALRLKNDGFDATKDPDFSNYVKSIDLNDTTNLIENEYLKYDLINFYLNVKYPDLYKDEDSNVRYYYYLRDSVENKMVKAYLADIQMNGDLTISNTSQLDRYFEIYKQLSNESELYKENEKTYATLSTLRPGVEASDFEMQDVNGKTVRFHDVIGKGKVTYIDFWATWCAPCVAEIPFLEKLVEEYKENPKIEFVSISMDSDLNLWRRKLEQDKPKWAQYILPDNFESPFAKEYNIRGIPRFMVFDGEGRILSINEERPSHENFKAIINAYIQQ